MQGLPYNSALKRMEVHIGVTLSSIAPTIENLGWNLAVEMEGLTIAAFAWRMETDPPKRHVTKRFMKDIDDGPSPCRDVLVAVWTAIRNKEYKEALPGASLLTKEYVRTRTPQDA